jgi:hypothetical protein
VEHPVHALDGVGPAQEHQTGELDNIALRFREATEHSRRALEYLQQTLKREGNRCPPTAKINIVMAAAKQLRFRDGSKGDVALMF